MGIIRKLKRRVTNIAEAWYEKGLSLYLDDNNPDKAIKYLIKAADTGNKKAYGEIGIILYREKNEVEKAREWFKKAEESGAFLPAHAYEYGMLRYLEDGEWQTGLEYLFQAANEGYELAYGDIGSILYLYQSDVDNASEWFRKAIREDCLFPPNAHHYGLLLIKEKEDWQESLKYLRLAAEGEFEPAYGDLGAVLYYWKDDIDEAEKWFKKAEEVGELDPGNAYAYGELLVEERGDIERGNYFLEMAEKEGY